MYLHLNICFAKPQGAVILAAVSPLPTVNTEILVQGWKREVEERSLVCNIHAITKYVRIYKEYHSVCPLVKIGTLQTPL